VDLLAPERLGRSVRVEELLKPAHLAVVERDKMDEVRVVRFAGEPYFASRVTNDYDRVRVAFPPQGSTNRPVRSR